MQIKYLHVNLNHALIDTMLSLAATKFAETHPTHVLSVNKNTGESQAVVKVAVDDAVDLSGLVIHPAVYDVYDWADHSQVKTLTQGW